jgi:hypothetical protein
MGWVVIIGKLVLGFILGTLLLWICSLTVNTQHSNIKTAALYNLIMTLLGAIIVIIGLMFFLPYQSLSQVLYAQVLIVISVIISFVLLMRLYDISFLATIWLLIFMRVVYLGVDKLTEFIF